MVCVKLAGRDAGRKCVILKEITPGRVLIDGETRRRECNVNHLYPLQQILSVAENASHDEVVSAFKSLGIALRAETAPRTKTRATKSIGKPVSHHVKKQKPVRVSSSLAKQAAQKKIFGKAAATPAVPATENQSR